MPPTNSVTASGGEQRLPDSLFGAVLIGGFVVMLLLDQIHTAVAKGKTFQVHWQQDT